MIFHIYEMIFDRNVYNQMETFYHHIASNVLGYKLMSSIHINDINNNAIFWLFTVSRVDPAHARTMRRGEYKSFSIFF